MAVGLLCSLCARLPALACSVAPGTGENACPLEELSRGQVWRDRHAHDHAIRGLDLYSLATMIWGWVPGGQGCYRLTRGSTGPSLYRDWVAFSTGARFPS